MDDLAPYVIAFSDDGRGVQSDELMEQAMLKAKKLNKMMIPSQRLLVYQSIKVYRKKEY